MTDSTKIVARVMSLVITSVILSLVFVSFALARRDADTYPSNIWLGGVYIGNLTREEALNVITNQLQNTWGKNLSLKLPDKKLEYALEKMGVNYDYSASLERAEEAVTASKGLSGLLHHATIRGAKQNINPVFNFDKSSLTDQLNSIKLQYDKPALDARIMYANDYLEYISHRDGYSINIDKSLAKIMDSLCQGSLEPIELEIEPVYPRVRLDDIKEVKDVLGISLMKLPGTAEQYKALQTSINGVIFMPDESFTLASFLQDGWASNQQLCQLVDKTITEACTEAGLKVEGTPGYYTNTLEDPILLAASLDNNSLIIKIYGCQTEEGKEIKYIKEKEKIEPGVQFKTDRHVSPNQRVVKREGTPGLVDRQYRVVKLHGKVIEKTLLSEQTTPAVDTIILVGPGTIKK